MPRIRLADDREVELPEGEPVGSVLDPAAIAARVDGLAADLSFVPLADAAVRPILPGDEDGLHVLRHSTSHVMAQAVCDLFPGTAYAIGPAVEDGFYYDFDLPRPLGPEDLEAIEARMAEIVAADQPFVREEIGRDEALERFAEQPFKREIAGSIGGEDGEVASGESVSIYRNGDWSDLCLGPHVPSTGRIGAYKLMKLAGAYWRGDESRPMLQRIYGTAWATREDLDAYLVRLEEAERRDHRRLGRELDLFSSPDELGPGLWVWHQRGGLFRKQLEDYVRELHLERGYDLVVTPHIARGVLWETSGHLAKFAENMYPPMHDEQGDYYAKPMNCPFHVLIYRSKTRSYRELPLRLSELGTIYRHERLGALHGLLRIRGGTQDDSHIFCTPDQLVDEILKVFD
ncbi:MAG TPA: threonine--tRNA ligase, partial [Actinomycetota bacterium]|nr:threonine--tRNA ligase [Actinomycetota bacterium]